MFIFRDTDLQARLGLKPLIDQLPWNPAEQLAAGRRESPTPGAHFETARLPTDDSSARRKFYYGSPASEPKREVIEGPLHTVTISHAIAVGRFRVMRDECGRFASKISQAANQWQSSTLKQTGTDPVVNVNWYDANAYAAWLSQETGHRYRLLSEAEYEYAQRAGTSTAFWWGANAREVCSHANGWNCGHSRTVPVGSYPANAFGLYDMAGNIWEWTEDCWNSNYEGAPVDGTAWMTGDCSQRIPRGGSQYFYSEALRSAHLFSYESGFRTYDFGFRVARAL
jgi:formylglycine-generating enzyme required for sulfatase activity